MKIAIVMNNGTIYNVSEGFETAADVRDAITDGLPIYVDSTVTPNSMVGHATKIVYPVLANVSAVVELR